MSRNELVALLFSNMETITLMQATTNLLVALICAVIVYAVYYYTSKDAAPTSDFAKTVLIVTLSVSLIVMLIGSNLALSLGMVGALSIIRFRAAVKDSRDAAFIFYAIAVAMASALGVYQFALLGAAFIGAAIIIFSFFKVGSRTYLITVRTNAINPSVAKTFEKTLGRRYSVVTLSLKRGSSDDMAVETVYEAGLARGADALCEKLSQLDGVISVSAVLKEAV